MPSIGSCTENFYPYNLWATLSCSELPKDARSEVKAKLKEEPRSETIREIPTKTTIYIYMWPKGVSTSQNFPDSENTKVKYWNFEMFLSSSSSFLVSMILSLKCNLECVEQMTSTFCQAIFFEVRSTFWESNFIPSKSSHQMTCPKSNPNLEHFFWIFFWWFLSTPKMLFVGGCWIKSFKEIWTRQVIYGYLILLWLFDRQLGESAQDLCDPLGPLAREVDWGESGKVEHQLTSSYSVYIQAYANQL